jgi:hypothetical protein
MPTAEARVETARSSRYLVQLCQHIGHMGDPSRHFRRRPAASHAGDEQARRDVRMSIVESSDTHAVVDFAPWGRCTMDAIPDALTLRVDAGDEENLRRLQDVLTRNLTRFGRRDHLDVTWHGSGTGVVPEPPRRRPRWLPLLGIVLIKLAIIASILMLPSGLALSLGASHVVALLVLLVAAAGTALVYKLRGKPLRPLLSMARHRGHR